MKLNDLDLIRLLPGFMQDDGAVKGLAAGVNAIIPSLAASCETMSTWDHINDLDEDELDELAWELNILWYDPNATIAVKRDIVLNSDKVWRYIGTKWAVENVIKSYFGNGYIEEWFEYGGKPGRFRVNSSNPSINAENLSAFLNILGKVKRASAKLDTILITLSGELKLSSGVAFHETTFEQIAIGANVINK